MKCFNHSHKDALGICKNCSKGICEDCLTEVKNGIACTSSCIDEVNQINLLINKNKENLNFATKNHQKAAFIYLGFGLVFIVFGITTEGLTWFLTTIGFIFIIGAIFSFTNAKKLKNSL